MMIRGFEDMANDLEKLQEGYRIIVVEDEEPQLEIWGVLLQEVIQEFPSMWVHTFRSSEEAYKSIIEDNHVALVIADYHLSESNMSGYDLFKRLRTKGKEFPFAIVSGDKTALDSIRERNVLIIKKPMPEFKVLAQEIIGVIHNNQEGIFRSHVTDEITQVKSSINEMKKEQKYNREITEESLRISKELKEELKRHTLEEEKFQKLLMSKFENKEIKESKSSWISKAGEFARGFFSSK